MPRMIEIRDEKYFENNIKLESFSLKELEVGDQTKGKNFRGETVISTVESKKIIDVDGVMMAWNESIVI